jgi:hypothetical protein
LAQLNPEQPRTDSGEKLQRTIRREFRVGGHREQTSNYDASQKKPNRWEDSESSPRLHERHGQILSYLPGIREPNIGGSPRENLVDDVFDGDFFDVDVALGEFVQQGFQSFQGGPI